MPSSGGERGLRLFATDIVIARCIGYDTDGTATTEKSEGSWIDGAFIVH